MAGPREFSLYVWVFWSNTLLYVLSLGRPHTEHSHWLNANFGPCSTQAPILFVLKPGALPPCGTGNLSAHASIHGLQTPTVKAKATKATPKNYLNCFHWLGALSNPVSRR